jgi:hypothetical protein
MWCALSVMLACAALVIAVGTAAASNRDSLVLTNGDIVRGEITALEHAKPNVVADGLGTVSVKWDHVTSASSPEHFEVETTSRRPRTRGSTTLVCP